MLCIYLFFAATDTEPCCPGLQAEAAAAAAAFCPRPEEAADVNKQTSHCAGPATGRDLPFKW